MISASKKSYLSLVYLFLYIPIIVVIWFSFNNAERSLLWHGFTLRWYVQLFHDQTLAIVTLHSLIIAFLASTIATLIGMIASICLYRYRFFGKKLMDILILMLIIIPDLVMGISLLILFSVMKLPLGFWSLLLAHISFCVPFVCVTVTSRLVTLDKHLFEAGKDLGASEWQLYTRILIPLLAPALISAWLLSFTLSIDDVIISYFVSGPEFQILPLTIFSMVKVGVNPEINALCTILFLVTLILAVSGHFIFRRPR
jgi:spermidine/putrescine transport system permease protein